jgi:hypothetical protein
MEDSAAYLARRIRAEHHLSDRATEAELLRVCEQRGVTVIRRPLLHPGYYCDWPHPLIVVRPDAPPRVTAHELFHHLIADNARHGVDYRAPEFLEEHPETLACRFQELLCGAEE